MAQQLLKLSEKQLQAIASRATNVKAAEAIYQSYMQGILDQLDPPLNGDKWSIDKDGVLVIERPDADA